jgi:hypothetical protein
MGAQVVSIRNPLDQLAGDLRKIDARLCQIADAMQRAEHAGILADRPATESIRLTTLMLLVGNARYDLEELGSFEEVSPNLAIDLEEIVGSLTQLLPGLERAAEKMQGGA